MTTQEMIEFALLDAVGLLDEQEREAFERAFGAAAPAVQAQVRREQTRLSQIEMLLPDVSPPAGLRAAVIEAVRRAMAAEAEEPATLAFAPPMARSRGVSRWWRAGSLGLATAAAVFMCVSAFLWNANLQLRANIQGDVVLKLMAEQLGHAYVRDVLLDSDTQRQVFTRVAEGSKAEASIFVNPEWRNSMFVCAGLAPTDGRPYRLAIVDENDEVVEEIAAIEPSGLVTPLKVKKFDTTRPTRLAVFAPGDGSRMGSIVSRGEVGGL